VAGLSLFSSLMHLSDLKDDGDFKLVVADHKQNRLKVYMNTNVLYIADLKAKPVALTTFYESSKKPFIPVIAVAIENTVYFFKEFNAYMKFELPNIEFSAEEQNIWKEISEADDETFVRFTEQLYSIREGGTAVSCLTNELISMEDFERQREYVILKRNSALVHHNYITCMSRINKSVDEEKT
jgi:hypothetical protein